MCLAGACVPADPGTNRQRTIPALRCGNPRTQDVVCGHSPPTSCGIRSIHGADLWNNVYHSRALWFGPIPQKFDVDCSPGEHSQPRQSVAWRSRECVLTFGGGIRVRVRHNVAGRGVAKMSQSSEIVPPSLRYIAAANTLELPHCRLADAADFWDTRRSK